MQRSRSGAKQQGSPRILTEVNYYEPSLNKAIAVLSQNFVCLTRKCKLPPFQFVIERARRKKFFLVCHTVQCQLQLLKSLAYLTIIFIRSDKNTTFNGAKPEHHGERQLRLAIAAIAGFT